MDCCDRSASWHAYHRRNFGYAHAEEIDPPIPMHPNVGAPQQVVDELKAMTWDELVAYCDMVLNGFLSR